MPPLATDEADLMIHKGETDAGPGYSGFDNTPLAEKLSDLAIDDVAICGLAMEYCVRATAIDALKAVLRVTLLTDLIRPVRADAVLDVLQEMAVLGIAAIPSKNWLNSSESTVDHKNHETRQDAS